MHAHTQIFVFFPEDDKVGVKSIKTFAERMRNEGVSRAVMVTQANMTPFARQCLAEMQPKYYIEVVRMCPDRQPTVQAALPEQLAKHLPSHVNRLGYYSEGLEASHPEQSLQMQSVSCDAIVVR